MQNCSTPKNVRLVVTNGPARIFSPALGISLNNPAEDKDSETPWAKVSGDRAISPDVITSTSI